VNSASLENWSFTAQAIRRSSLVGEPTPARSVNVPIWSFSAGGVRLLCDRPVQVTLSEESDGFFAECERLHIYASAPTPDECMKHLNEQVIHFFHSYSSLEDHQVISLAHELRALYQRHFRRA
jgi:hypothetical protein